LRPGHAHVSTDPNSDIGGAEGQIPAGSGGRAATDVPPGRVRSPAAVHRPPV